MMTPLEVDTPDGRADARLFTPGTGGPWPLVVFYMDAGGLRPAMSSMAERLVSAGYAVLQPNLYWRSGPFAPFDAATVFADPAERTRLMALLRSVRADQTIDDTRRFVDQLAADPRLDTSALRLLGYCMGGRMAFLAAAALGSRVHAVAAIHAGGLVGEGADSPHHQAGEIRGKLYLGVADADRSCTPEHQQVLKAALDTAGVRYTLELYPGALHGFAVPDFPEFDAAAAEHHWDRVLETFA